MADEAQVIPAPSGALNKPQELGQRTPLRHFHGRQIRHVWEQRWYDGSRGGKPGNRITCVFTAGELSVVETTEPWTLPTHELRIGHSAWDNSPWATLTKSLRDLIPGEVIDSMPDPIDLLDGKMAEWKLVTYKGRALNQESGKWEETAMEAWAVVGLEGYSTPGGPSITDELVAFADGKNTQQIKEKIYSNDWGKMAGFQAVIEGTSDGTLLPSLVTAGKLSLGTDGLYHKVA